MILPGASDDQGVTQAVRLEDRIYFDLLGRIQAGTYPQGARLPTENEFAAEFGVSRPVVRAALARLREAGLVVSRQGAGSFVNSAPEDEGSGYEPLGSIVDIADYFSFRRLLECEVAALAADRCTPADLPDLHALLHRIDTDIGAGQATIDSDVAFHARLGQIAGNRFLAESVEMLQPHMRFVARFVRSLTPSGYVNAKKNMQIEHRAIADAVGRNDAAAARAAMERHVRASETRIFKGAENAG